jgi:16S rRNA processing protein RimM
LNHKRTGSGINDQPAGSPTAGEPAYFDAGFIRRPHGVKGELLVEIDRKYDGEILPGAVIFLSENHIPKKILSVRFHNQGLLIQLDEINNPEQAGQFRLQHIYVSSLIKRRKLKPGEYFPDQIMGLRVCDDLGQDLGIVSEIIETGANDVYVVSKPGERDILLPAIPDVIQKVDLESGEIFVHIIPGLMDL